MNIYTKDATDTLLNAKATVTALTAEATARVDADTTLQTNVNKKQDKLTFDTTPTANSTNPVTSGGIKTYVDSAVSTSTVDLSAYLTTANAENTYAKSSSIIGVAYQDHANTFTPVQYFKGNIVTHNIMPETSNNIYSIGESAKPYRNIYATKLYGLGMVQAGDLIITTSMQYYDGTSTWTYTLPAKTGTIALTSDIPSTTTDLVFYNSDNTVLTTVKVYNK